MLTVVSTGSTTGFKVIESVEMTSLSYWGDVAPFRSHNPLASFAEVLRGAIFAVRDFHHCILLVVLQCCTKRETA